MYPEALVQAYGDGILGKQAFVWTGKSMHRVESLVQ